MSLDTFDKNKYSIIFNTVIAVFVCNNNYEEEQCDIVSLPKYFSLFVKLVLNEGFCFNFIKYEERNMFHNFYIQGVKFPETSFS